MALEAKGTRSTTMPLTLTKKMEKKAGKEEIEQAIALLTGGLPWRVSPSASGGGWGDAMVCREEGNIRDMLEVEGGGKWLLQQHVEADGELRDLKALEVRIDRPQGIRPQGIRPQGIRGENETSRQ
jgi:hypothetical protein